MNIKSILTMLLFLTGLSSFGETHDFRTRDSQALKIHQKVLGVTQQKQADGSSRAQYFEGIVTGINGSSVELFPDNGAQFGFSKTYSREDVYRAVKSKGDFKIWRYALHRESGEVHRIHSIYENGLMITSVGVHANTHHPNIDDLFASCECIKNICEGDTIISQNGEGIYVDKLFSDGTITFPEATVFGGRRSLNQMGNHFSCSAQSPCQCRSKDTVFLERLASKYSEAIEGVKDPVSFEKFVADNHLVPEKRRAEVFRAYNELTKEGPIPSLGVGQ